MTDASTSSRSQSEGAQRLLDAAIRHVLAHGYQDDSLRAMAERLGTSHRMLSYYFGSSDGFWEALLSRLRLMQHEGLTRLASAQQLPTMQQIWDYLSGPDQLPQFRLMFEIYGRALTEPARHQVFLEQMVERWLDGLTGALMVQYGWNEAKARPWARLRLAVIRGLMLDLLTTGDREGIGQALALFEHQVDPQAH